MNILGAEAPRQFFSKNFTEPFVMTLWVIRVACCGFYDIYEPFRGDTTWIRQFSQSFMYQPIDIFRCQSSEPIFLKKLYGAFRNTAMSRFSRLAVDFYDV